MNPVTNRNQQLFMGNRTAPVYGGAVYDPNPNAPNFYQYQQRGQPYMNRGQQRKHGHYNRHQEFKQHLRDTQNLVAGNQGLLRPKNIVQPRPKPENAGPAPEPAKEQSPDLQRPSSMPV
jgi:hypothetical protein